MTVGCIGTASGFGQIAIMRLEIDDLSLSAERCALSCCCVEVALDLTFSELKYYLTKWLVLPEDLSHYELP